MVRLNIGCGKNPMEGFVNLDISGSPDVLCDLEEGALPFPDNTFDLVYADHVLEHIKNLLPLVQEIWRVTTPNGVFHANVPYVGADQAFEDPTHIRYFAPISFGFFSQPIYWRSDYGYRGDFKIVNMEMVCHQQDYDQYGVDYICENYTKHRNLVQELRCTMQAVKPARPAGEPPMDPIHAIVKPAVFKTQGDDLERNDDGELVVPATGDSGTDQETEGPGRPSDRGTDPEDAEQTVRLALRQPDREDPVDVPQVGWSRPGPQGGSWSG